MNNIQAKRRNFFVVVAVVLLCAVLILSSPPLDTERFKHIIPIHSSTTDAPEPTGTGLNNTDAEAELDLPEDNYTGIEPTSAVASHAAKPTSFKPQVSEKPKPETKPESKPESKPKPTTPAVVDDTKVGHFHYLIPGSQSNLQLCYNLLSSAANQYPVPLLLGFNGTGQLDAHVTHLAKLRVIERYLDSLEKVDDDDLVMIVDGYDVIQQLPPDIVIERYFNIVERLNVRTAKRFGIKYEDVRKQNLQTTVLFGPDKICWPIDYRTARCWAVPASNLPKNAFGPHEGNGDMKLNDPRWLNSGTVIGPVKHMRDLIHGAMAEIKNTYDPDYQFKESDQYYLSNVWGRQEYYRSVKALKGERVPGGGGERIEPLKENEDQQTEYHVGIEYESALFQTRAGYENFFGWMQFKHSGLRAEMDRDLFDAGADFRPYQIQMPPNVLASLSKLYDAIPEAHPGSTAADWIRTVRLGTNYVTKHIFTLWHCTGPKEFIVSEFPNFWFYPYAKSLLRAAVRVMQGDDVRLAEQKIDGRIWKPKHVYPDGQDKRDEFGGAWSDYDGRFMQWGDLCGRHYERLFSGEKDPEPDAELARESGQNQRRRLVPKEW